MANTTNHEVIVRATARRAYARKYKNMATPTGFEPVLPP